MSRVALTLGGSPGERATIALVVVLLVLESVVEHVGRAPQADPMTHDLCAQICYPAPIQKMGAWECECVPYDGKW